MPTGAQDDNVIFPSSIAETVSNFPATKPSVRRPYPKQEKMGDLPWLKSEIRSHLKRGGCHRSP
jgi:hypothetical protein